MIYNIIHIIYIAINRVRRLGRPGDDHRREPVHARGRHGSGDTIIWGMISSSRITN